MPLANDGRVTFSADRGRLEIDGLSVREVTDRELDALSNFIERTGEEAARMTPVRTVVLTAAVCLLAAGVLGQSAAAERSIPTPAADLERSGHLAGRADMARRTRDPGRDDQVIFDRNDEGVVHAGSCCWIPGTLAFKTGRGTDHALGRRIDRKLQPHSARHAGRYLRLSCGSSPRMSSSALLRWGQSGAVGRRPSPRAHVF
jgi:hypothetical protein